MPRRKQGTPQRLKLKASPAIPGDTENKNSQLRSPCPAVAEHFYANRNEVVTTDHHALDSEKICVSDDEKTVKYTFVLSEETGENRTTKETGSPCSFSTDFQDSIETMEKDNLKRSSVDRSSNGFDKSQSANDEEGQGWRRTTEEGETNGVTTSPLHTLANAAVYRSSTPVNETQNGTLNSISNGKPPDLSMPIKKRAKRSPTPTDNNAALPGARFFGDKQRRVSQDPEPDSTYVDNSDARLGSFGHTTSSALSSQATHGGGQTTQLNFMEAMMQRQRQLYEECADNSWMSVQQRSDNNCLSKSKAERYRWCVQENTVSSKTSRSSSPANNNNKSSTGYNSHVADLKKSTSLIGSTYPMQDKLYSTVFTGASKFRCRDCGSPFNTLVDLTVHMNKTGHYRDQNIAEMTAKGKAYSSKFAKPKKRSIMEMEEKDSAEKVLKCMGCGHSFDSLQDLSVHMIKTKHYQDVPSLRFFSQKNDLSNASSSSSSVSHIKEAGKSLPAASVVYPSQSLQQQQNNNNIAASGGMAEQDAATENPKSPRTTPNRADVADLKMPDYPMPHMFGSLPSLANMQMMAAQSLLGFNPYLMPFGNGYCTTNSSFAAAAASLLFTAPWLSQLQNFGHAGVFSPFLHPQAAAFPPSMLNSGVIPSQTTPSSPPCSTPPFKTRGSDLTKDERPSYFTQNVGISRYGDDYQRSKSQILRCLECGESFSSLQKLTDHMQETTHFAKLKPRSPHVSESCSPKSREAESSGYASISQRSIFCPAGNSQKSNTPVHSPSLPNCSTTASTASPLEHLAKLANGRSLDHSSPSSSRYNSRADNNKSHFFRSSSPPHSPVSSFQTRFSNLANSHREKYLIPLEKESPSKVVTGFDFIKSLESTIQSAISKVKESPCSPVEKQQQQQPSISEQQQQEYGSKVKGRSPESRDLPPRSSFNPFMSSISSNRFTGKSSTTYSWSKAAKHAHQSIRSSYERPKSTSPPHYHSLNKDSPNRRSASPNNPNSDSNTSSDLKNELGYIPLDLTKSKLPIMKDLNETSAKMRRHSESRLPLQVTSTKISVIKSEPTADYSVKHSSASSSHSATSSENSKVGKSVTTSSPTEKSSYKFSPPHGDQQKTTNPLMEIQKIVNATELTRRPESMTAVAAKDDKALYPSGNISTYHGRKRSNASPKREIGKRYKPGSVLSDLVTHDDDSEPTTNPLAQMEHLVNLRIGENSSPTIKTQSSKPKHAKRPVTNGSVASTTAKNRNSANPMSALLNFFEATNGLFRGAALLPSTTQPPPRPTRVSPASNPPAKNNVDRSKAKFAKPACKPKNEQQETTTALPDETSRLRDKMADFFRSMVSNDRSNPEQIKRSTDGPSSPKKKKQMIKNEEAEVEGKSSSSRHVQQNENGKLKLSTDNNQGKNKEPIMSKSCETRVSASLRPEQELYLQYYYVMNLNRGEEAFNLNNEDMEVVSRSTDLRPADITAWYAKTRKQLSEKNDCDFIRLSSTNGDGGAAETTLLFSCTSGCEHFTETASATEFLNHLRSHFDSLLNPALSKLNNSSDHKRPPSSDESGELERAASEWKMVYQGALRFGSYKSNNKDYSLTAMVGESSALEGALMRSESPSSTDEVVSSTRHCAADGLKVTDDSPIQVSG